MDSYDVLVIILSITLAICLIIAIVCLVLLSYILGSLKRIMIKAEAVADNVEEASEFFKNTTSAGAALKMFTNIVSMFSKNGKDKDVR